jgi:hypothetical protein
MTHSQKSIIDHYKILVENLKPVDLLDQFIRFKKYPSLMEHEEIIIDLIYKKLQSFYTEEEIFAKNTSINE